MLYPLIPLTSRHRDLQIPMHYKQLQGRRSCSIAGHTCTCSIGDESRELTRMEDVLVYRVEGGSEHNDSDPGHIAEL